MTVWFIGAGPGDPDLLTIRGKDLISTCPVCLYAGSLVPEAVIQYAPNDAYIVDTAELTLEEIINEIKTADRAGHDVARVHSGDPSLYGAIGEQIRCLETLKIDFEIIPGVPAYAAAAALLKKELTLPGVAQTIILTRTAMKASQMPIGEDLDTLGKSGATLAIHLSIRNLKYVCETLVPYYGIKCPVAVIYRASWPDQKVIRGTLGDIRPKVLAAKITRTALIIVGKVLSDEEFKNSSLYDPAHTHLMRPNRTS